MTKDPETSARGLKLQILLASLLLGAGLFAPCMTIKPSFGEYSGLVRMLNPALTAPETYSIAYGIVRLYQENHYLLAAIILIFSALFPAWKITVYWIAGCEIESHESHARMVELAAHHGKYSMVDVLVIALLVLAIKGLPGGTEIVLRWGVWAFAASVLLTIWVAICYGKLVKGMVK